MIGQPQLKARIARLDKLADGLTAEMATWKDAAAPLLPGERDMHAEALQAAVIGLGDTCDSLEDACCGWRGRGL